MAPCPNDTQAHFPFKKIAAIKQSSLDSQNTCLLWNLCSYQKLRLSFSLAHTVDLVTSSLIQQVLLFGGPKEVRNGSLSMSHLLQALQDLFQQVQMERPGNVHPRASELTLSLLMAMYDRWGGGSKGFKGGFGGAAGHWQLMSYCPFSTVHKMASFLCPPTCSSSRSVNEELINCLIFWWTPWKQKTQGDSHHFSLSYKPIIAS